MQQQTLFALPSGYIWILTTSHNTSPSLDFCNILLIVFLFQPRLLTLSCSKWKHLSLQWAIRPHWAELSCLWRYILCYIHSRHMSPTWFLHVRCITALGMCSFCFLFLLFSFCFLFLLLPPWSCLACFLTSLSWMFSNVIWFLDLLLSFYFTKKPRKQQWQQQETSPHWTFPISHPLLCFSCSGYYLLTYCIIYLFVSFMSSSLL